MKYLAALLLLFFIPLSVWEVCVPMICCLIAVGFYTLMERKVLGYIQTRKGPNKVSFMGIFQPFSDAGKLLLKEYVIPTHSNPVVFISSPVLVLSTNLMLWVLYPYSYLSYFFVCFFIQFLCISSFSVYGVMLAGWSSNSKYALLGSVRAVAQTISYEVPMTFILLCCICGLNTMWSNEVLKFQSSGFMFFSMNIFLLFFWVVVMLAETNRTPFDLVEGESELVSGFNVEYSSGGFMLIFMAEYSGMLFMSIFSAVVFVGGSEYSLGLFSMIFVFFFLWSRGTLPRMRYDKLMYYCWSTMLVFCMFFFCLLMVVLFMM